jgi:hypothetical protein
VVEIPPSTLAPHQTGDRYPRRHGTTTAWMDEPEVERFYRQRRELIGEPLRPGHLIEVEFFPAWPEPAANEVGELHLVVRPQSTEVMHPAGPWLAEPLTDAIREATRRQSSRFTNPTLVKCFRRLQNWRPYGVAAWRAGHDALPTSPLSHTDRFGATHALPAWLSFQAQWALLRVDPGGQGLGVSARELDVIRELIAMLACQWPSVSPHWRPRNSPLVAIVSPRWWPSDVPTGGHRFSPPGWIAGGQVRGLTPFPAVAWASR